MDDLLSRVYQVFDPAPLAKGQHDLYVELDPVRGDTNAVNRLVQRIRLSSKVTCQLLAGHRGSGKSTELRQAQHDLEKGAPKFFVVYCEADDDIDRNDVDFPDILIAVIRQMADQLRQRASIDLKPGYFADRWSRLKDVLGSEVTFDNLELGSGMLKISAAIKSSPDARRKIRQLLEPDTSNLIAAANDVISQAALELQKLGYHGLVIIVDDLDKMVFRAIPDAGCSSQEYLFIHREGQLSAFSCHMVYTMPLALAYSHHERTIENLYGCAVPVVPMTKLSTKPPANKRYTAGIQKFRELIAKRLTHAGAQEEQVFATTAIRDRLIMLSGGQPRELMILIRDALISGGLPITNTAVDRTRREGSQAYTRQLRAEHWPLIEQARKTGNVTRTEANDRAFMELLDSRALLQYKNDKEWYGPNPLIADLKPPPRS